MTAVLADDGFAGAGGWDLAARALDIHARGIENMPEARATRDAAGLETIHDDVWTFVPDGRAVGKIDSPPCQTFSNAGHGSGRKALQDVLRGIRDGYYTDLDHLRFLGLEVGDERTSLVLTPLHFATQYPYEWLAWEQVPGVLPVWEACAVVLRAQGWHVWTGLLHAEQHGVPQTRKRAFLLASRHRPVAPPRPTHSRFHSRTPQRLDPGVRKWVSMAEALGWGLLQRPSPTVTGGGTETGGAAEPIAKLARYTGRPDWRSQGEQQQLELPSHMGDVRSANGTIRGVDQPAPTITGSLDNGNFQWDYRAAVAAEVEPRVNNQSGTAFDLAWPADRPAPVIAGRDIVTMPGANANRFNGSTKSRNDGVRVTVQEAGVLQSFPPDYPWAGNKGKQYLQAGNAVPPLLAVAALAAVTQTDARDDVLFG